MKYQGRGFLQLTGKQRRNTLANISYHSTPYATISTSPITITTASGASSVAALSGQQIQALQGLNTQTFNFSDLGNTHSYLKKYEMYESTEDILALGVASHRMFNETKSFYKLTDRELYNKISPDDRTMANAIRDYYSKKVMMWKLKGNGSLTGFRDEMNKLVHSDGLIFKENVIGIAYYLPLFYQYDLDMDMVKSELTKDQGFSKMDKDGKPRVLKLTETLQPLNRLNRVTRSTKKLEYWFKDTEYDAGVVINLEAKNQLQHLWDQVFNKKEPLKIEGFFARRKLDDFEYYSITDWKLVEA